MNLVIVLLLVEDLFLSFKVLVIILFFLSSEYLEDLWVLNVFNKMLFVFLMDFELEELIKGVFWEIMDNDGFIDVVGECIWCLLVVNCVYFFYFDYVIICIVRRMCEFLLLFFYVILLLMVCELLYIFLCVMRRFYVIIWYSCVCIWVVVNLLVLLIECFFFGKYIFYLFEKFLWVFGVILKKCGIFIFLVVKLFLEIMCFIIEKFVINLWNFWVVIFLIFFKILMKVVF